MLQDAIEKDSSGKVQSFALAIRMDAIDNERLR
jgi:hypothetical protein